MSITVLVNGAAGRMGSETVNAIQQTDDLQCVAELGKQDDLAAALRQHQPDVVVDFTNASVVFQNSQIIIENHCHPVIGSSGLTLDQIATLQAQCQAKQLGGIIAPNFSLGAVLMMHAAAQAAKYLPDVEIIELHHPQKLDAPSGTALKTADLIAENRQQTPNPQPASDHNKAAARGHQHRQVPIHAIRLPGLIAHQTVLFGGHHETLTLRHDSFHRASFMPGVLLACRQVIHQTELLYGLENVLLTS